MQEKEEVGNERDCLQKAFVGLQYKMVSILITLGIKLCGEAILRKVVEGFGQDGLEDGVMNYQSLT
ncbi:MAG: hypothetical protein HUU08_05300 [Candidatus Brocadia sp.]|nr:hypothetical protein [Candidatus Brocadia sp.]